MTKQIDIFEPIKDRVLQLIDEKTCHKEISFAIQHIKGNNLLEKATIESKQKAVLNVAQIGLTLNPVAKETFLVPRFISYKDGDEWKKKIECCLEPSYVGLVKLLTDAGSVTSINTQIHYEGDIFDIDLATATIQHKPYFINGKEKGNIIGAYSRAKLLTGEYQIEYMTAENLYDIRDRSESYKAYKEKKIKSCIWTTDETEMMRKTVLRRIYKYLPRTDKMDRIDNAIELDNLDYKPSAGTISYIESLLQSSVLGERERIAIGDEISIMSNKRAYEVINYLKDNQKGLRDGIVNTQTINDELDRKIKDT